MVSRSTSVFTRAGERTTSFWFSGFTSVTSVSHGSEGCCRATELHHFGLYWCLCEERFGREAMVARLQELAALEVQALTGQLIQADAVRMHSVGVQLGA